MPAIRPEEAAKKLGGKLFGSPSRLQIALIVDAIFVKTLKLFDLSSISPVNKWLLHYAREHLFQKMQTLFQMGKKQELLELLDFAEEAIPVLKQLANNPDVFITVTGRTLKPEELEPFRRKPIPKWVKRFIENHWIYKRILKMEAKHKHAQIP